MQDTPSKLRLCAGKNRRYGSDSMNLARSQAQPQYDLYKIVPDGYKFGIAMGGEIVVHGLELADLERVDRVVSILNSFIAGTNP
jgi:hypothetical protein